jgi:hypothetical protein
MVKDERGYALIMVLFMILLLTILGTAVVSSTIGGATRAETREADVQSLHLAEKTLNEAASYLVTNYDGREDLTITELESLMDNVDFLKEVNTNTEYPEELHASGKIISVTASKIGNDAQNGYSVNLIAEAEVNHVTRRLEQEVLIEAYPDFLNYAFGSENDVTINGAFYALGNIYAGKELKIDNYAKYTYNNDPTKSKETKYPSIDGSMYVQSMDAIRVYDRNLGQYRSFAEAGKTLMDILGVENNQVQLKDEQKFVSINVVESFIDKAAAASGRNRVDIKSAIDYAISNQGQPNRFDNFINVLKSSAALEVIGASPEEPALPTDLDDEAANLTYEADMATYNNYFTHFYSLSSTALYNGSLTLDGIAIKRLEYNEMAKNDDKWFIVNGDLNINNANPVEVLKVKANMLVTGNVYISGKVLVDSTIFSLGQTTVEDAEIKGIVEGNSHQQLILISKGKVLLNKVDKFNNSNGAYQPGDSGANNPKMLDAFFYTDADAELYGVGSLLWINGGFFSKGDLTINAVLGDAYEDTGATDIRFDSEPQASLSKDNSRFIINYNQNLFRDQYEGLPRVKQLSVEVHKKRLVTLP